MVPDVFESLKIARAVLGVPVRTPEGQRLAGEWTCAYHCHTGSVNQCLALDFREGGLLIMVVYGLFRGESLKDQGVAG